jgi:hypothetical protein
VAARVGLGDDDIYKAFPTIDDCYQAAFQRGLELAAQAVDKASGCDQTWSERIRARLVALLGFFDDEPSWARLLVLETPGNPAAAFDCRQRLHGLLGALLAPDHGAEQAADAPLQAPALTAELVAGGVLSVIRTSMLAHERHSRLVELAPSLTEFVVTSYLGHVADEDLQGRPSAGEMAATLEGAAMLARDGDRLARAQAIALAAQLPIRATHRTTLVLNAIARAPYSNNREVAHAAGLTDEGQTSRLLARLERHGVIENFGNGAARGEPNAWLLTASGHRALAVIGSSAAPQPRATRTRGQA